MADFFQLRAHATSALQRGAIDEALDALVLAAGQTHVGEHDYAPVLRMLGEAFVRRGDPRSALTVLWYTATKGDGFAQAEALLPNVPVTDRARTFAAMGNGEAAATELENAGRLVAAAIQRERLHDFTRAEALWSRLEGAAREKAGAYEGALVTFNVARCAKRRGDARRAHDARVRCVGLLEEAADDFEARGQRERAFDCFQVLIEVGREGGAFEDVLEGYVNAIRILREDNLKTFALQHYDDVLVAATERGEFSAAANLAREASDYARKLGAADAAAHYGLAQARCWRSAAAQHEERGAPAGIAENALLAALLSFSDVGQYAKVGALYRDLADLDIDPARRTHYARAAKRYEGVADRAVDTTSRGASRARESGAAEVWHVDLIEWEERGSAAEACADVLLDRQTWADLVRRKALVARLTALAVESRPDDTSSVALAARVRLAGQLAQLQLYGSIAPLEALFARGPTNVKIAVLDALRQLFFKRSFVTLRAALHESDAALIEPAAQAIEGLGFAYAFDPLARILREFQVPRVRAAAIVALSRIDTQEAAELLFGTVAHGAPSDRMCAIESLKRARGAKFLELARRDLAGANPDLQGALRAILAARGLFV